MSIQGIWICANANTFSDAMFGGLTLSAILFRLVHAWVNVILSGKQNTVHFRYDDGVVVHIGVAKCFGAQTRKLKSLVDQESCGNVNQKLLLQPYSRSCCRASSPPFTFS